MDDKTDQLSVQLAACLMAAEGDSAVSGIVFGDYAHSEALDKVRKLYRDVRALREQLGAQIGGCGPNLESRVVNAAMRRFELQRYSGPALISKDAEDELERDLHFACLSLHTTGYKTTGAD